LGSKALEFLTLLFDSFARRDETATHRYLPGEQAGRLKVADGADVRGEKWAPGN